MHELKINFVESNFNKLIYLSKTYGSKRVANLWCMDDATPREPVVKRKNNANKNI